MSVLKKRWIIKNEDQNTSLLQKLLANRGLHDEAAIERFFHPEASRDFHDPFLMKDMRRAVERIGRAIEKSERIMVFGDYDVDGITGAAILMRALTKLGASVSYRLPHRIEDGYGLREKFVREFAKIDVKLIITVDNGISCFHEVEVANSLNVDVIISDHHTVPEKIPNAYALLHPKLPGDTYPFTELTGAGVALKLAQALFINRLSNARVGAHETQLSLASRPRRAGPNNSESWEQATQDLFDLACMGTIADLGPMIGENRYIVKEGLRVLENTRWPGLSRLKESAGVKGKIDTHTIGFLLGPRINAAGRISHPSHALRLLLHDREHTGLLAKKLENLNRQRQTLMGELLFIAEDYAQQQSNDPLIAIADKRFHGGVIGLLAAKMSEKYFRPAIVMEERSEVFVGSCRSIPGINVVEVLNAAKDLLSHYGGHAAAAGFDLPKKNFKEFVKRVKKEVKAKLSLKACQPTLSVECEIAHDDISPKTIEMLKWFEPFGVANEKPRFLCRKVPVRDFTTVGSDKTHLRFFTNLNGGGVSGIGFRLGQFLPYAKNKKTLDLVCEMEENTWNGKTKLQLKLIDFA